MRLGSLFTGTGALDLAAEDVLGDLDRAWHSDVKPAAERFLAHRHPDVPNLGDLTRVWPAIGPLPRETAAMEPVDVLTAGWPCQPHSSAGKRLGEADPRALWPNVLRAIRELRPAIFLGENVARIVTNGELRRVIRTLAEIGYVGAWRVVAASDIGAPHQRKRCFVVAAAADTLPAGREGSWPADVDQAGRLRPVVPSARPAGGDRDAALTLFKTPTANLAVNGGSQHPVKRKAGGHGPTRADEVEWLLYTPCARDHKEGSDFTDTAKRKLTYQVREVASDGSDWGRYAAAVARWEATLGVPAPAPTQTSPRTGKPQLSPRFVEWMMGLPAGWVTDVPDLAPRPAGQRNAALSMLGDGVVPQQAARAYRELLPVVLDLAAREAAA